MTSQMNITADTVITKAKPVRDAKGFRAFLAFLIEKDRNYREARKLAKLDADRLRDMGMPGISTKADFYQARGNGPADATPTPLTGW